MNARQRRADRRKNESHLSKELRQMERAGQVTSTRVRIPKDFSLSVFLKNGSTINVAPPDAPGERLRGAERPDSLEDAVAVWAKMYPPADPQTDPPMTAQLAALMYEDRMSALSEAINAAAPATPQTESPEASASTPHQSAQIPGVGRDSI